LKGWIVTLQTYTIPSEEELLLRFKNTPFFMKPNLIPFAVVYEGALAKEYCEGVAKGLTEGVERHEYPGCKAKTREVPWDYLEILKPIEDAGKFANEQHWKFDLDIQTAAWMQTYEAGDSYLEHMDGGPASTRKLTAVALLTDPDEYMGGDLLLKPVPDSYTIPRTQGTVVIFPFWMPHLVTPIHSGIRQTINLGYWGPPLR
jgi:hypothetical protein